ncbi:NAD(P)-dependent oxidoreductase [Eubacteriales bacterium OttesenSCG-928-N14]|nr:NAD(P)-dependent oxidoreductase [Eubacteriales bacterium OttesenSCG-928-N14]
MSNLNIKLHERELAGAPVRNAVIGVGMMGTGIVDTMTNMEGMSASFVADVSSERAKIALLAAGIKEADIVVTDDPGAADNAIAAGKHVASGCAHLAPELANIDVITDSTGVPEVGADMAFRSITAKKHFVMMTVETDICIGPLLKRMADSAGVVYTGASGDEPAATMELINFARAMGLQVVAAGKGKNTPWHPDANPDNITELVPKFKNIKNVNWHMICEFVDGSKTAIEMSAIANAAGLLPDVRGMHGPDATRDNLHKVFTSKERGGVLTNTTDVIEYCIGISPGVFCVVRGTYPAAKESFASFNKDGNGDDLYPLYRPYHLTSLETPLSAAKAVLLGESSIAPIGMYCEVITRAKKDLAPGEKIDRIGGYCVLGSMDNAEICRQENLLPLSLAQNSTVKRAVKKGEFLTYDDVELPENSTIVQLRSMQDKLLYE